MEPTPETYHKYAVTSHYMPTYEFSIGRRLTYGGFFRLLENVRVSMLDIFSALSLPGSLFFVVRSNYVKIHRPNGFFWDTELRAVSSIHYLGKSSLQLSHYVGIPSKTSHGLSSIIVECITTCVMFDGMTGRSADMPSEMVAIMKDKCSNTAQRLSTVSYPIDEMKNPITFEHAFIVGPSLIDSFGHTNQSRYVDCFNDALYYSTREKNHPIYKYASNIMNNVESISIDYIREVKCGYSITIKIAPVLEDENLIGMTFEALHEGKVACRATFRPRLSKM